MQPLSGPMRKMLLAAFRTGVMPWGGSGNWKTVDALVARGLIRREELGTSARYVLTDRGRDWCEATAVRSNPTQPTQGA